MKLAAVILSALCISSAPYHVPDTVQAPDIPGRVLTLYESATAGTVVPADILRAVAMVESGEDDGAVGDGGKSHGRFQINERFRAERVRMYGDYDPHDPTEAARVAAAILGDHFARFGSWPLALTAYNAGAGYAKANGVRLAYVNRVHAMLGAIGSPVRIWNHARGMI